MENSGAKDTSSLQSTHNTSFSSEEGESSKSNVSNVISSYKNSVEKNEMSLKDIIVELQELWKYLSSKWFIILIGSLIGCAIGLAYAISKKPVFTAETTFVLEDADGGGGMLGQLGGLASLAGIDQGGGGGLFQVDNIIQLYKSRAMIERTLLTEVDYLGKRQLMIDHYIEFNKLREKWFKNKELSKLHFNIPSNTKFSRIQDSILGVAVRAINSGNLQVSKLDAKSSIIKVQVKSKDEFFAKSFNDELVQNVNDFYVQTKTKKSFENLEILQHQTDSVRNVLNGAIYSTAAVADATPNLNPTRQVLRAPAQRYQFNAEANKAILTQMVQNLELAKLSLRKETPLIQVVDQPVYPLEKNEFGKVSGVILGGVVSALLTVLILILRKKYQQILHG